MSLQCKTLIQRILSPVRSRLRMTAIVTDPWLIQSESEEAIKANTAATGPQVSTAVVIT